MSSSIFDFVMTVMFLAVWAIIGQFSFVRHEGHN